MGQKLRQSMIHIQFLMATNLIGAVEFARDVTAFEKFVHQPFRKNSDPVTFNQIIADLTFNENSHFDCKKSSECKITCPC